MLTAVDGVITAGLFLQSGAKLCRCRDVTLGYTLSVTRTCTILFLCSLKNRTVLLVV